MVSTEEPWTAINCRHSGASIFIGIAPDSAWATAGFRCVPALSVFCRPMCPQEYRYEGRSQHLYGHFRCAEPPLLRAAPAINIPLVQDLGDRFPALYESFEEVVRQLPRLPAYRVRARLWDILSQLGNPHSHPDDSLVASPPMLPDLHPAVRAAVQQIEMRLGEPLRVSLLCERSGVSSRYLSQLFRAGMKETIVGYIRQRRVERALHLLQHSTLSVKSVAIAVGIPDLHLFNKTVRAATGQSPRAFRERFDGNGLPPPFHG